MDTSKVIRGVVNSGRYTVTAPIVKEDYGLYLQIEGVELPSTYEVDFSNSEHNGTSVTMIGNSDGVLIPHQFISTGKNIFAFLYHVGEDFGRTVYKFRIPNKVRPDRTNEEPTPEEQSTIDQAISALNEAIAQTAQDVIDANASAQSASQSAENAHDSAVDAQNYAESAQTSANNASASAQASANSATASAQSASQSAQIKADVEDLADDAQSYASASAQSASASANSASQAQGYAQSASASAQSASTSASDALTYANTASSKATEASTSAQTASTKATESAQSASQALTYKNDAESAKTASQTAQGLAESARDTAVSAKTDAESARDDAVQAKEDAESAVASISGALAEKAPIITDTALGSIASFTDGADNLPLKSLVIDINPIQDLSNGDPSPENLCPISGWTEVDVEQRGSNLWDGLGYTSGSYLNVTGGTNSNSPYAYTDYIPVAPNSTYYVSGIGGSNPSICWYDKSKNFIGGERNGGVTSKTISVPSNAHFIRVSFPLDSIDALCVNYPSTDHSYHPYTGRSITIDLGQTVYGGKLNVLSGELVVDRAMVVFDGTETFQNNWFPTIVCAKLFPKGDSSGNSFVNSHLPSLYSACTYATNSKTSFQFGKANEYWGVSSADELKAIFAQQYANGTPVTICYPLAEPITIQLTPQQVNSLLGVNNIWADSGDTTAEYRADTKLYIAKKIAEAISALS